MRDNDVETTFSWTIFLIVTGISFLLFSAVMEILRIDHSPAFPFFAIACLCCGILAGIGAIIFALVKKEEQTD